MDANQKHPEINEYAESVVRVKARQLVGYLAEMFPAAGHLGIEGPEQLGV